MRCHFIRDGNVVGVAMLPPGSSRTNSELRGHTSSPQSDGAGLTASRSGTVPVWSSSIWPDSRRRSREGRVGTAFRQPQALAGPAAG